MIWGTARVLALGDGDEEGSLPSSTVAGTTPTDPFLEFLAPPGGDRRASDRSVRTDGCQVTRYTWYSTPSVANRPSATNTDVLSHA
jgi:hypothetical protein